MRGTVDQRVERDRVSRPKYRCGHSLSCDLPAKLLCVDSRDDIYQNLRRSLLERVHDKESAVRVQAIVALAKLQGGDDDEEEEGGDGEDNVTAVLLDILRHDPSA